MKLSRDLVKHLAVFTAFGFGFLLVNLLLTIHAHGGVTTVDMTQYGERYVEVVMCFVLTPFLALGLHYYIVDAAQ